MTRGLSTATFMTSAWNWHRKSLAAAPPSTRSSRTASPASAAPPRDRRQEAVRRCDGNRPGVEQHEASRAVGVLRRAGRVARLPEQRRLLVAGHPGDRHAAREPAEVHRLAEDAGGRHDGRQHRAWDAEDLQHLVVPCACPEVEAERARGVRRVSGVNATARELPEQPRVDGAEGEVAALRAHTRPGNLVPKPAEFRAREVGVEDWAGLPARQALDTLGPEPVAQRGRPATLPDDGALDRSTGHAIPHDGRLALVRDADGGELGPGNPRLGQRRAGGALNGGPDFLGVVLDPARLREILRPPRVSAREHAAVGVDDQGGRPGRALIEGEDVTARGHRPRSRFTRSGRSLMTMSTPRSIMRRTSASSLTVHAARRTPAARAAANTSASTNR